MQYIMKKYLTRHFWRVIYFVLKNSDLWTGSEIVGFAFNLFISLGCIRPFRFMRTKRFCIKTG